LSISWWQADATTGLRTAFFASNWVYVFTESRQSPLRVVMWS
jgi:hypothetical protein